MFPIDCISEFLKPYPNGNTIRTYSKVLEKFKLEYRLISNDRYFHAHIIPKALNNLFKQMHVSKYSKSTHSSAIYILNTFFNWAIEKNFLERNPMDDIERIRLGYKDFKPAYLPSGFNVDEFIKRPDQFSFKGNNARLIIFLLAGFGLKRSEIANLKIGDLLLSEDDESKMIIRNNNEFRTRVYTIEPEGVKEFRDFLERRNLYSSYPLNVNDYLLHASNGEKNNKPIDGSTIFRVVQRYLITEEEKKINPSSFRLYKALTSIYTRKYYELDHMFGMSHKEIAKYKIQDAKERLRKESAELIEEIVKARVEEELRKRTG